ncbi:unnamed protein product [Echinostoma caproni]|uniref:MoaC domain-containing protein n=1 Tax=Echinostoma caproni TaxID=27848 RepID=A0A183ATB0_9TREM|nr:unnamed protein product [Echinostoma caproni]
MSRVTSPIDHDVLCRCYASHTYLICTANPALTHYNPIDGGAKMVDITEKAMRNLDRVSQDTTGDSLIRWAMAEGKVTITESIRKALFTNTAEANWNTPKGNVMQVARLAGIQAAKQTSHLIPLCHQIPLTMVQINFRLEGTTVRIQSVVKAVGKATGVEMEALTAVAVAALTTYDMLKSVEPSGIVISQIELLEKHGGKSGSFVKQANHGVLQLMKQNV